MIKFQDNVKTNGLGMGDQAEVSGTIGMGQLMLASGLTAGIMAAAAIVVEGVKYYWFKDKEDGVVLRSEDGLEVKFETIEDAQRAANKLKGLIKEARAAEEAEEEAEEADAKDDKKKKKVA